MSFNYLLIAFGDLAQREALAAEIRQEGKLPLATAGRDAILLTSQVPGVAAWGGLWLIGELFRKDRSVNAESMGYEPSGSQKTLLAEHWGRYVAIRSDAEVISILRDPSGALPCYYRRLGSLLLVASDLGALKAITPGQATLDWNVVEDILSAADLRTRRTAISGISELLPGELLSATPTSFKIEPAWLAWPRDGQTHPRDFIEHAEHLREQVQHVMTALGNAHPHSLATVSGGLDSSIVALALGPVVRSLTCLTLATADPAGDERRYARLTADASGGSYVERFLEPCHVDLRRSQAAHLPRPIGRPHIQAAWRHVRDVASQRGATAVFNGTGGDNIFCFLRSATPIIDRFLADGIGAALSTARDIAQLTGATYLQVFSAALRRARLNVGARRWRRDERFLAADRSKAHAEAHPWLCVPEGVRPGTAAHIMLLLRIQNYLDPWDADCRLDMVNPLLAQPIVECCLTIPSWQWCQGGIDRAVARRAFADRLPPMILARRWKGGPDSLISTLFELNRPLIRAALVDGVLADRGVLDRGAITAVLDEPRSASDSDALRLLILTDAEAWVRLHA